MDSSNSSISKGGQKLAEVVIVNIPRAVIKTFKPLIKLWVDCRIVENNWDRGGFCTFSRG